MSDFQLFCESFVSHNETVAKNTTVSQALQGRYHKLPKLTTRVRFPSPAPRIVGQDRVKLSSFGQPIIRPQPPPAEPEAMKANSQTKIRMHFAASDFLI